MNILQKDVQEKVPPFVLMKDTLVTIVLAFVHLIMMVQSVKNFVSTHNFSCYLQVKFFFSTKCQLK